MKKTLLVEVSGVVEAPMERVWQALLSQGTPETPAVEVVEHTVAYQGGWWYRGEWSVEPHPQGTLVVHRVFNVATWLRWGVPLANRFFIGFDESTRKAFREGIAQVGNQLGCSARLA